MSQGNQSCLRFSLEESVWFQKGQEVAELISISLDPNITIQENDLYVTIQGSLELTGEYKRHEDESSKEDDFFSAPKFVQTVEEREEGICEFMHRFPVDITIPNNRIQSIYDINVDVESFDYVFHERSCMKLTADLTITGLYGDQQHVPAQDETEASSELETEEEVEIEVVTAQVESVPERELEPEPEPEPLYRSSAALAEVGEENSFQEEQSDELTVPFEAEARKKPAEETEVQAVQASSENKEVFVEEAPIVQVNEAVEPTTPEISFAAQRNEQTPVAQEAPEVVVVEEEKTVTVEEEPVVAEHESESSSSSPEQMKKKKKLSKKKTLTLSEFFARKEEQEDLTKLKVCIVQSGDTLDLLAERYEVSVQQLLRVNHLEVNQDVYEGQVLYIPQTIAHS